jgi:hypothetical protein
MNPKLNAADRAVFKQLTAKYEGKVIAPHVLRIEQTITNSDSIYTFPVLQDGTVPLKTEIRLNKNDILFMTHVGLYIYEKTLNQEGAGVLQTYPNEIAFTTGAGFTKAHLETIYNSQLRLKVGTREFVSGLDTRLFRWVPQTQQSAATNKSQADEDAGMIQLPTYYSLRGTDEIEISLSVPVFSGIQMANIAPLTNQLVLKCKGFLIKGGASLK